MNIEEITELEEAWIKRHPEIRQRDDVYGWEPYPAWAFESLLLIAMSSNRTGAFLDVGSGIGTKVLIAQQLGLSACGIDMFPEYAAEADSIGVRTILADVREFQGYDKFGIVYINHPLRDRDEEFKLERMIQEQMAVGAALITVNNLRAVVNRSMGWEVIATPLWPDNPMRLRWDFVAVKVRESGNVRTGASGS
jgi:SAM-dependent methyltransferase